MCVYVKIVDFCGGFLIFVMGVFLVFFVLVVVDVWIVNLNGFVCVVVLFVLVGVSGVFLVCLLWLLLVKCINLVYVVCVIEESCFNFKNSLINFMMMCGEIV